jgi:prevent-host-death family protein
MSTETIPVSEAKARLTQMVRRTHERMARYVISRKGRPEAVLMGIDDFEGWIETLEILSDRRAAREIRKAKAELRAGKLHTFEAVTGRKQRGRR